MSSNSLLLHRFQVPCHIQEKFYLIFSRFNISDIQYPHFLYTPLICQRHLLVYQGRMDSPQPKIIMRTPPIRYMIIYPVSSLTGTFFCCREMTDITIIVIAPHQRHFIGYLQPSMVHIKTLVKTAFCSSMVLAPFIAPSCTPRIPKVYRLSNSATSFTRCSQKDKT